MGSCFFVVLHFVLFVIQTSGGGELGSCFFVVFHFVLFVIQKIGYMYFVLISRIYFFV